MATPLRHNAGLTFGCSCPGCGADLEFRESLWVTTCTHCETVLRIVMPGSVAAWVARADKPVAQIRFFIDRYCKEHDLAPPRPDMRLKQLYYPYWRFNALLLKVRTRSETRYYPNDSNPNADVEETHDIRAVSLAPYSAAFSAGPTTSDIPDTLGLRGEYLRLFPFADPYRDPTFDTVPVVKTAEMTAMRITRSLIGLDNLEAGQPGANSTRVLRSTASLIYFPYIIAECYAPDACRIIVDGVTGKVTCYSDSPGRLVPSVDEMPIITHAQPVLVQAHRCENCGSAFDSSRSLVYQCADCGEWTMLGSGAGTVSAIEWREGGKDDFYLPFWCLKIPDAARREVMQLFGSNRTADWIVVPAFECPNSEAAYRLTRRATGSNLASDNLSPVERPLRFHPITVEYTDAVANCRAALIRASTEKQLSPGINEFEPAAARLIVLPFHSESYFLVDSLLGAVTVEQAAIAV